MVISIGSDHAGYELKKIIAEHLSQKGYEVIDEGTNSGTLSASYVQYGKAVAGRVSSEEADFGILVCGTGLGMSMVANKFPGVRAALCTNSYMSEMARLHNNANILALGARVLAPQFALSIVDKFFATAFEGERHSVRLNELSEIEDMYQRIESYSEEAMDSAELDELSDVEELYQDD